MCLDEIKAARAIVVVSIQLVTMLCVDTSEWCSLPRVFGLGSAMYSTSMITNSINPPYCGTRDHVGF